MVRVTLFLAMAAMCWSAIAGDQKKTFSIDGEPELELSNISGDITIERGPVDKVTVAFEKQDDRLEVEFEQSGNDIAVSVKYPRGRSMHVSGGVSFRVFFPEAGDLEIQSVSGDISVKGVRGDIELQTVSGSIHLSKCAGDIEVQSVSGGVVLEKSGEVDLEAVSVSGSVSFSGNPVGDLTLVSTSGRVNLIVDKNASFEIEGTTISGSVNNELGNNIHVKKHRYAPTKEISGEINGGDASIEVSSISGSINLKKL